MRPRVRLSWGVLLITLASATVDSATAPVQAARLEVLRGTLLEMPTRRGATYRFGDTIGTTVSEAHPSIIGTGAAASIFLDRDLAGAAGVSASEWPGARPVRRLQDFPYDWIPFDLSARGEAMVGKQVKSIPGSREVSERLFRWTEAGGLVVLPAPEAPGNTYGWLRITEDGMRIHGLVVRQPPWGSLEPAPAPQLMRWSPERGVEFLAAAPGGWQLTGLLASGDGEVLAGSGVAPGIGRIGYRWTGASGFHVVAGLVSISALSRDGSVVSGLVGAPSPGSSPASLGWCRVPGETEPIGAPRHADGSAIDTLEWSIGLNGDGTRLFCCTAATNALYGWRRDDTGFRVLGRISDLRMGAILAVTLDGTVAVGWGHRYEPRWGEWITLGWVWSQAHGLQTLPEWLADAGLPTPAPGTGPVRGISDDATILLGSGPSGAPVSVLPTPRGWLMNVGGAGRETAMVPVAVVRHPAVALEFPTTVWSRHFVEQTVDWVRWTRVGAGALGDGSPYRQGFRADEFPGAWFRVETQPQ